VNSKESILPVCDKPYHTNTRNGQKGEEVEVLQKYALIVFINYTYIFMLFFAVSAPLKYEVAATDMRSCVIPAGLDPCLTDLDT